MQDVLARNDVTLVHDRASFVGAHAISVATPDGARTLHADNFLIAVGTQPGRPRGAAADGETLLTSDSVLSMKQLPRRMVVVGAGVIGIEYTSMFAALGEKN